MNMNTNVLSYCIHAVSDIKSLARSSMYSHDPSTEIIPNSFPGLLKKVALNIRKAFETIDSSMEKIKSLLLELLNYLEIIIYIIYKVRLLI